MAEGESSRTTTFAIVGGAIGYLVWRFFLSGYVEDQEPGSFSTFKIAAAGAVSGVFCLLGALIERVIPKRPD